MVKVQDIYNYINSFAPFESQMDFDNSGLLVGSFENEVKKIGVVLDITTSAVKWAAENNVDLIISHHPVIFNPLKKIDPKSPVFMLVQNGISAICAHTNLDCADGGVNDCLADALCGKVVEKVPDADYPQCTLGRIIEFEKSFTAEELKYYVNQKLNTKAKTVKGSSPIKRVLIAGGSAGEYVYLAEKYGADAVLTGESRFHHHIFAIEENITLIEAGHFETENVVIKPLAKRLSKEFSSITTVIIPQKSPTGI